MISITRSGVKKRCLPISACRPTGPPMTPDSAAPIVSVRLGRSRSSRLRRSAARQAGESTRAGRAGDTVDASGRGDTVDRSGAAPSSLTADSVTGAEAEPASEPPE